MAANTQPDKIRDVLSHSAAQKPRQRSDMASTRFLYRRDDRMVKTFFETNVYKSAALLDLIYLFILEHGPDADVSQLLRDRIVAQDAGVGAGSVGADTAQPNEAESDAVSAPQDTAITENDAATSSNASSTVAAADDADDAVEKPAKKQSAQQPAQQKPAQSSFDISDMM